MTTVNSPATGANNLANTPPVAKPGRGFPATGSGDAGRPVNAQTGTTYTFKASDIGKVITASNAAINTFTAPLNAVTRFPVGSTLEVLNLGVGVNKFAVTGAATANGAGVAISSAQWKRLRATNLGPDVWFVTVA